MTPPKIKRPPKPKRAMPLPRISEREWRLIMVATQLREEACLENEEYERADEWRRICFKASLEISRIKNLKRRGGK